MKKVSIIKAITLFLAVMLVSASLMQCKKTGDTISGLNRSFKGTADTALYASFYESNTVGTADATPVRSSHPRSHPPSSS